MALDRAPLSVRRSKSGLPRLATPDEVRTLSALIKRFGSFAYAGLSRMTRGPAMPPMGMAGPHHRRRWEANSSADTLGFLNVIDVVQHDF